jgi:hypothetical protein
VAVVEILGGTGAVSPGVENSVASLRDAKDLGPAIAGQALSARSALSAAVASSLTSATMHSAATWTAVTARQCPARRASDPASRCGCRLDGRKRLRVRHLTILCL